MNFEVNDIIVHRLTFVSIKVKEIYNNALLVLVMSGPKMGQTVKIPKTMFGIKSYWKVVKDLCHHPKGSGVVAISKKDHKAIHKS